MITTVVCVLLLAFLLRFTYVRNRKWRPEDFMRDLRKIMRH